MLRTQSSLKLTAIIALVCLIAGAVAPALITQRTRPLSFNEDVSVTMGPTTAQVRDSLDEELESRELEIRRHSTTAKVQEDDAAAEATSQIEVLLDDEVAATIDQHSVLNRESTYPMAGIDATQEFLIRGATQTSEIEGINYFFPSQTEQRSYPYFDSLMQRAEPIDYLTDEEIDGIPTYSFHQERTGVNVSSLFDDQLFPARAGEVYSDAELARYDLDENQDVNLKPYYDFKRTIWVEPTTGRVLNTHEDIQVYLAQSPAGEPSEMRTLFAAEYSWDEESTQRAMDKVQNTVMAIRVAAVIGWALAIFGGILLLLCAWRFSRQRAS